jgi:hypothetical protein
VCVTGVCNISECAQRWLRRRTSWLLSENGQTRLPRIRICDEESPKHLTWLPVLEHTEHPSKFEDGTPCQHLSTSNRTGNFLQLGPSTNRLLL